MKEPMITKIYILLTLLAALAFWYGNVSTADRYTVVSSAPDTPVLLADNNTNGNQAISAEKECTDAEKDTGTPCAANVSDSSAAANRNELISGNGAKSGHAVPACASSSSHAGGSSSCTGAWGFY